MHWPRVYKQIGGPASVAQSIVIQLDPHRNRAAAIESVRKDFSGSIRTAIPQIDARNLGRLRSVPWLIALLIALLAVATLVHALITMFARNRKDQNSRPNSYNGAINFSTNGNPNTTGDPFADALMGNFQSFTQQSADP